MKILMILPEYPPAFGGMQTHAVYLSRMLHNRNHDIEVVTYRSLSKSVRKAGREYDSAQPFVTHRILSRTAYWSNIKKLCGLVRSYNPDLVYSSTIFHGILGDLTGYPVVCRSVGNDILRCWIGYPYRPFSRLASTIIIEKALNRLATTMRNPGFISNLFMKKRQKVMVHSARAASMVLANSDFTGRLLCNIGVRQNRISVVVGGVDFIRFDQSGVRGDRNSWGFFHCQYRTPPQLVDGHGQHEHAGKSRGSISLVCFYRCLRFNFRLLICRIRYWCHPRHAGEYYCSSLIVNKEAVCRDGFLVYSSGLSTGAERLLQLGNLVIRLSTAGFSCRTRRTFSKGIGMCCYP